MSEIPKEKLTKVIDALVDSSVKLSHLEVELRGVQNTIDEVSAKLFFHYEDDEGKTK